MDPQTLLIVVLLILVAVLGVVLWSMLSNRQAREAGHVTEQTVALVAEQVRSQLEAGAAHVDSRKELIDAELARVSTTLEKVTNLVQRMDTDRAGQLGAVSQQLQHVAQAHGELTRTAGALREALSSSQARGQWGERMAEDVLRAAGFLEGVNYRTQTTTRSGTRPDLTFLLPGDQVVHMDVKFPLGHYLEMLEATSEELRATRRKAFLRSVRDRVKELDGRGYIDPEDGTLDCVLLFIPNEQVYGFVQEHDPQLLDDAMARKVVLCSPTTLFAVLAVIRRSVDSFALARTSDEILQLLGGFSDQWHRFTEAMEKVGRGLQTTQKAYDALASTRRNQLERQLGRIEELRSGRGVGAALAEDGTARLVPIRGDGGGVHQGEETSAQRRAGSGA